LGHLKNKKEICNFLNNDKKVTKTEVNRIHLKEILAHFECVKILEGQKWLIFDLEYLGGYESKNKF